MVKYYYDKYKTNANVSWSTMMTKDPVEFSLTLFDAISTVGIYPPKVPQATSLFSAYDATSAYPLTGYSLVAKTSTLSDLWNNTSFPLENYRRYVYFAQDGFVYRFGVKTGYGDSSRAITALEIATISYTKGALVTSDVAAENGTYPENGRHTDGYWYVRKSVVNNTPTINVASPSDARTLYENDTFSIAGTTTDADSGNVVSVKYSIDGGATQAITASVSSGTAISFAKNLVYKSGKLYDGATAITSTLAEGSQHTLKVWAEDDQGGKSTEIIRTFYVVPNRAATLNLDAFVTRAGLIDSDVVNINGTVADLDNGNVIVKYKIGNGAYTQVFNATASATPTPFDFNVLLADLVDGANQITIQAVDAYSAVTQQVITLNKTANEEPLKTAVTYYEITPPNGTTDGLQLYVEREVGDLVVTADVFMGDTGAVETFVPMTLESSANLTNGNVEDTFSYQHSSEAPKAVVRITMTRTSTVTNKAIKKLSGVLL